MYAIRSYYALTFRFYDLNTAFFCNKRSIDVVDSIFQDRSEKSFQEGDGYRAGIQFSQLTAVFDIDLFNTAFGNLHVKRTEHFAKRDVRPDLCNNIIGN